MVELTVDGQAVGAEKGKMLLPICLDAGFDIPHLCYNESVRPYGACRLCLVEVRKNGRGRMTTSCTYPVIEGIEVLTQTEKVLRARRLVIELILAMCPGDEEIQEMAREMGVEDVRFEKEEKDCILCGLCGRVCEEVVGANAIHFANKGSNREMIPPFAGEATDCIACGACVTVCPVNVIGMREESDERTIIRWKRTLKMKKCKVCGNYFAPWFQLEKFRQQAGLPTDFFDTCYSCRE
ncbi:MAG: 2Fe-2S iron-sulfur cluster binding domain-containing protein [Proteobacteria bacterium]|nr:2Fe-2S iron-sulfur cluster binding domain-containing protein [Pseudomonadota bacterium]NIS70879.1 2Fe-2S iron-sulfur cluster binding domain-containing protein [Pseudomonadota bacterium]